MSSDATDNTMRAEFEAVYRSNACQGSSSIKEIAWIIWQAARADTARQVEEATRLYMQALNEEIASAIAAERGACAAVCDAQSTDHINNPAAEGDRNFYSALSVSADWCADLIRARSAPATGEKP